MQELKKNNPTLTETVTFNNCMPREFLLIEKYDSKKRKNAKEIEESDK